MAAACFKLMDRRSEAHGGQKRRENQNRCSARNPSKTGVHLKTAEGRMTTDHIFTAARDTASLKRSPISPPLETSVSYYGRWPLQSWDTRGREWLGRTCNEADSPEDVPFQQGQIVELEAAPAVGTPATKNYPLGRRRAQPWGPQDLPGKPGGSANNEDETWLRSGLTDALGPTEAPGKIPFFQKFHC